MGIPATLSFEGTELSLWTYTQLEQLGRAQLKQRALNLRDAVGSDRLPAIQTSASVEATIMWIISVQVALLKAQGTDCAPSDFGVPVEFGKEEATYFGGSAKSNPQASNGQAAAAGDPALVSAFSEAQRGAEAAKQRNRGVGIW